MTRPNSWPDAREVDRIEVLATPNDAALAQEFLARSASGSQWLIQIRTARVTATLLARKPLGSFREEDCTCLSFRLARPVPVEPGLRLQIEADDNPHLSAAGIIRPWQS